MHSQTKALSSPHRCTRCCRGRCGRSPRARTRACSSAQKRCARAEAARSARPHAAPSPESRARSVQGSGGRTKGIPGGGFCGGLGFRVFHFPHFDLGPSINTPRPNMIMVNAACFAALCAHRAKRAFDAPDSGGGAWHGRRRELRRQLVRSLRIPHTQTCTHVAYLLHEVNELLAQSRRARAHTHTRSHTNSIRLVPRSHHAAKVRLVGQGFASVGLIRGVSLQRARLAALRTKQKKRK